jgi:hypothetical protein
MSRDEIITTATICGAVVLWIMGDAWGVPAVLAAMLGLSTLLLTGARRPGGGGRRRGPGARDCLARGGGLRQDLRCAATECRTLASPPHLRPAG